MKTTILTLCLSLSLSSFGQQMKEIKMDRLSRSEIRELVQNIIDLIETNYVDLPAGKRVIEALNQNIESGEYDRLTTEQEFIRVVSNDMRAVSNDLHLAVRSANGTRNHERQSTPGTSKKVEKNVTGNFFADLKRPEGGFFNGSILAGGVGLVEFTTLLPPLNIPTVKKDLLKALDRVKKASHIIFDARKTRGGVPETIAFISSHLYGRTQVLLSTYVNRITGNNDLLTAPEEAAFYGSDKMFYVLTSAGTGSGAEAFAYMNQQHGRVIVVGEVSAGAGRLSAIYSISETIDVMIPENESIHPVSKGGFEKVGVQPDVLVDQRLALNKAHLLALNAMYEDKPKSRKLRKAIGSLTASMEELKRSIQINLERSSTSPFTGKFEGKRSIWINEEGVLRYRRGGSMELNLVEIKDNLFELDMSVDPTAGMRISELPNVRFVRDDGGEVSGIWFEFSDGRQEGPYQKLVK